MKYDIQVQMLALNEPVHEAVTPNEDGSYTIFINDHLAPMAKRSAYIHALRHIENSDFDKQNVQEIESAAHR